MQEKKYSIKTMTREEANLAINWAAAEGWNPGVYDADCFYAADPYGFLVSLLGNEPIATISAVKYGSSFGFLGLYIVKSEYRGQGFGIQIWNAALEYLKGRNIGLDSVVAQQENYQRAGFKFAYRNIRYEGIGRRESANNSEIVELSQLPFEVVAVYDQSFFPDERRQFVKCWIQQPESRALGIMQNEHLAGYGVLRVCHKGYKIGPLFADSAMLAESLFIALQSNVPEGTSIYFDTPEINSAAVSLAERYSMKVVFETARMFRGESPPLPFERLFGVTTLELG